MKTPFRCAGAGAVCLALIGFALGADEPKKGGPGEDLQKAEAQVKEYLGKLDGGQTGRVTPIKNEALAKLFPKYSFVAVIFPQYPIARISPKPLSSANVFAVPRDGGKPQPITNTKELEKFFKEHLIAKGKDGESPAAAWLRLSQELAQDGFFRFKQPTDLKAKGSGDTLTEASGKVEVEPTGGNKGEIAVTLTFGRDGRLAMAEEKKNLQAGLRPICQATKLLDPDPIVRRMAEDSIRVMGSAAKYYLDEQRAKANEPLREAIERAWRRILKEGR